jgi:CRISPR-associated protein Csy2
MNEPIRQPSGLLILHRLRVQNANAISSPLTWGFPSPTAFLGFAHALERRLVRPFGQIFDGVGIVCHDFEAQTFKPNRRQHRIFTQSRNPVYLKKDAAKFIAEGTPAAIVEEGHAHLVVSLLIAVHGGFDEPQEEQDFAEAAYQMALGMRLAGGSVLPALGLRAPKPQWVPWPEAEVDQRKTFMRLRRRLLPGFALVHRPDLLGKRLTELQAEGDDSVGVLDALLDLTRLNYFPVAVAPAEEKISDEVEDGLPNPSTGPDAPVGDGGERVAWQVQTRPGWRVPLPIGYSAISDLYAPHEVAGARDTETPFRFVESLYSLGQWIAPHRLSCLEQLLWHSTVEPDAGLYRCINRYSDTLSNTESDSLQGA